MSLLLRRQGAPVVTGLEETPATGSTSLVPVAQSSTPTSEDFIASNPTLEEAISPVLGFAVAAVVLFSSVEEEFGGAHPTEEIASAVALSIPQTAVSSPSSEDFAGAHPTEETASAVALPTVSTIVSTPVDEDFVPAAAVVVAEEDSPFQFIFLNVPSVSAASAHEDFAGSLPLEEQALANWISQPVWISGFDNGEEFGLPHPTEETSVDVAVPIATFVSLSPPPEDFGGSLPVEEATDETAPFIFIASAFVFAPIVVSEDFAGSLPLEEPSPLWTPTAEPIWLNVSFEEEFGLPHPTEEAGLLLLPPIIDVPILAPPDEEFAGSLPAEEAVDEAMPFIFTVPPFIQTPFVVPEDFAGSLPFEEPSGFLPTPIEFVSILIVPPEDFAGSLPLEEGHEEAAPFIFNLSIPLPTPLVVPEDFAGSLPLEEFSSAPTAFSLPLTLTFDFGEFIVPQPVPPPPPPPFPGLVSIPATVPIPGPGGGLADWCRPQICYDDFVSKPKPKREKDADYALLPLGPEVAVRALADGIVETFKDEKGGLVVRLTADDGTTYFYAKVKKVKTGRVKKGDVIGVSTEAVIAPKALPPPKSEPPSNVNTPSTHEPEEPKGVFGVLPVAPQPQSQPQPKPLSPAPPRLLAPTQTQAAMIVRHAPPSVGTTIVVGVGIVGIAIVVAAIIRSVRRAPPPRKKKRRRRSRKRR